MENEKQELDEMIRRNGVDAYADGIAQMLAGLSEKNGREMDDAQIELIKQGISATLLPPKPPSYAMPVMPPPTTKLRFFREETELGITIYDWISIIQQTTHYHRYPEDRHGKVTLHNGEKVFLRLSVAASNAFWEWQEEMIDRSKWRPPTPEEIG